MQIFDWSYVGGGGSRIANSWERPNSFRFFFRVIPCYSVAVFRATWSGCHPNLLMCKSGSFQNATPMNKFIGCTCSNLINQVRAYSQPASAGLGFCEASVLTDADIRLVICRGWRIENNEFLGKTEFFPCYSVYSGIPVKTWLF
jgi:hypothetical protein